MKKIIQLITIIFLSINLFGCHGNTDSQSGETTTMVEVEEKLFDVSITIPASWYEDSDNEITQESLDAQYNGEGYKSATLNEDGSVTIIMTKAQHKEMMEGIEADIEESLQEMIDDTDYTFVDIKHNADYSEFTITLDSDEVGIIESFAVLAFNMYGYMYNMFNGDEIDNVKVLFYSTSGTLLKEVNSKDN